MISRAPFVSLAVYFMAGALAGDWLFSAFQLESAVVSAFIVIALVLVFVLFQLKRKAGFGVGLAMILLLIGIYRKVTVEESRSKSFSQIAGKDYNAYLVKLNSLPEKRNKSIRFEASVLKIRVAGGSWEDVQAKALVSIASDAAEVPEPGDRLVVRGQLQLPITSSIPGQFDYRRYLRNKGILWTAYLRNTRFQNLGKAVAEKGPMHWSRQLSVWADTQFRKQIQNDQSYGLVKAMLLGRRDDLRTEQVDNYIASGTVHILSVSGMHVAIIFLVLGYLFGWIKRYEYGKTAYLLIMVSLLCFYALVTGMAASVQRATMMCIVFVIAEVWERKNNSMNTLAISALLILLFDPSALYDVGFQLSYLAMAGIFLLYQPIAAAYVTQNRVTRFLWQVTALSLATQLATFPLSLFYFHQFPSYFWLINPFVISFTNILLPAAIVLLLAGLLNIVWIQSVVNIVVDVSARLTDWSVTLPKHLPGYLITDLHLTCTDVMIFYCLVLLVWYAYHSREYLYLKCAFTVVFLWVSISVSTSTQSYLTPETVRHQITGHCVTTIKRGDVLYIASDSSFLSDKPAFAFSIKPYMAEKEIGKIVMVSKR